MTASTTHTRQIWIDGSFVPWDDAQVHLLSHSMQRASLIFDYLLILQTERGPAIFRMQEHLQRLFRSAELVGLPLSTAMDELVTGVLETVRRNPGATNIKICAYLPSIEVDVVPGDSKVSVAIAAFDPSVDMGNPKKASAKGSKHLRLYIETEKRRTQPRFIPPQAKVSANYLSPMLAKWRAREKGYDDILLLDDNGNLTEAPTSNVFLVDKDGVLRTPSTEFVLEGVTRSGLIEVARRDGMTVLENRISVAEVYEAREVFLTTTSKGVWPVESIDGKPVGGPDAQCPGPVSLALRERFKKVERGEDPEFIHWLTFVNEEQDEEK